MEFSEPTDLILHGADDLATRSQGLQFADGALRLARADRLRLPDTDAAAARDLVDGQRLLLCDMNRSPGWIDDAGDGLWSGPLRDGVPDMAAAVPVRASAPDAVADSAEALELAPVRAPAGSRFTALAMRGRRIALTWSDGAALHGVSVVELGGKRHYRLTLDAEPLKVCLDPAERIWVVTADRRLLRCEGEPLPQPWRPAADTFKPLSANPSPLGVRQTLALDDGLPVAALCSDAERLYLVSQDRISALRLQTPFNHWEDFSLNPELPAVSDACALGGGRLALWVPVPLDGSAPALDCPVVVLDGNAGQARTLYERWPRRAPLHNAFVANPDGLPMYLSGQDRDQPPDRVLRLTALPQARYESSDDGILRGVADSRVSDTLWDRLQIAACIPRGSRLRLELRGYDSQVPDAELPWHDQGELVPVASPTPWELPLGGFLARRDDPGVRLWEAVIRRGPDQGPVREIRGRRLQIRVRLAGNGLETPRLYALALRHPRNSWQRAHLPEFMHQGEALREGATGLANGADVRERMLSAFAGLLEPIEARIDGAEMLLDPLTAPAALLPALAGMLGEQPPTHWPESRQRAWLAMAGELQRWRGSFNGLSLALDLATDGAVSQGRIVPLEDWRLRRPLFTALGVDFAAGRHPLTLDTVQSGNSIVGDTLSLGPDDALALLRELLPEADPDASAAALLRQFADRHAYRLSVVIHASAAPLRGLVEELLAAELPAHLSHRIIETDAAFVPGLAPLLGIHTFLQAFPAWRRMVLDQDPIGAAAALVNPPLLAPVTAGNQFTTEISNEPG